MSDEDTIRELVKAVEETLDKDFQFWSHPNQDQRRARLFAAWRSASLCLDMGMVITIREPSNEMKNETEHRGGKHHPSATIEERVATLEKEMNKTMADIDTLNQLLTGIADDATTLSADFKTLEGELQAAQEAANNNQPIDLTNSILVARNAQAALDAIVQAATPAPSGGTTTAPVGGTTTQQPSGADTTQQPSGADTTTQQPSGADATTGAPADGVTGQPADPTGAPAGGTTGEQPAA